MASSKRGFTLIEVLLVIAIIAVMVVVLFAAIDPVTQMKKARDSNRKTDLNQIKKALYLYYNDHNNQFPPQSAVSFDGNEFSSGGTVYMRTMPVDPSYYYEVIDGFQDFCLYAKLEIIDDEDGPESHYRCDSCGNPWECVRGECNSYYVCAD